MLSWILASASTTPNAPAEESQTMVTGRVCKNILGLFSNGIKETLEVKLKLVPVPTCMQSEYVENMERYHSLSKIMPEGMDYKEWAEFLKANPAIGQLAQPTPRNELPNAESMTTNTIESFNEMMMNNSSYNQHRMSFSNYDTRASSPAMSTASQYTYQMHPEFRPASQASFHSEPAAYSPYYSPITDVNEQPEEGPPKKRARVTKAKRPKRTTLGPNAESLRVTASTAASVRLHRPTPVNVGAAVTAEQVPRAPTPRPHHAGLLTNVPRIPAPSLLRNASTDEGRSYASPYDSGMFSDNAVESADDDKGDSPSDTPLNIPSSPPLLPEHDASPVPSSPELPMLPPPNDSGFASDMPMTHNERAVRSKPTDKGGSSVMHEAQMQRKHDQSKRSYSEYNTGLINTVPSSTAPHDQSTNTRRESESKVIDPDLLKRILKQYGTNESHKGIIQSIEAAIANPELFVDGSPAGPSPPDTTATMPSASHNRAVRTETPSIPLPAPRPARGLARSHTWTGEPMSDAAGPEDGNVKQPRSGSGAKRQRQTKVLIKERLEEAITQGQLPTFCNNCGQIETPAWRKAYTRIEMGTPEHIELSSKGNSIVAYEVCNPADNDGVPHYRIFKTELSPEEKVLEAQEEFFTTLTLCNSCGLWLSKKNSMRPQEYWGKRAPNQASKLSADKPKRIRKPKKSKIETDFLTSDAVIPESETGLLEAQTGEIAPPADGTTDGLMPPPLRIRSESMQASEDTKLDGSTARAALERAFQSSPVGIRSGSKDSAITLNGDLTPNPTRRLLFPSPRRPGEVKSLADSNASRSSPRSTPSKTEKNPIQGLESVVEEGDKENYPPPVDGSNDGLAHLFESPKTTPTKGSSLEDLLKTPTPSSRQRGPLTPSISSRTPRGNGRAMPLAPETPFTRQLNDLLSDGMFPGSPSQHFDFSSFPTFNTPGRNSVLQFGDLLQNDSLSSDLPIPSSSPPRTFDFSVFEDPNTSTVGLWSGASIFDINDAIMSDAPADGQQRATQEETVTPKILTVNGISLDFSAMIEEVVGNTGSEEQEPTPTADTIPQPIHHKEINGPIESRPDLVLQPVVQKNGKTTSNEREAAPMSAVPVPVAPLASRPDLIPACEKPPTPVRGEYDPHPVPKPRCLRCKQRKKGCDRQRPCGRCVKAGIGIDGCIIDEEAATSPAFSASAETPNHKSPAAQEQPRQPAQAPSIPVDPALRSYERSNYTES